MKRKLGFRTSNRYQVGLVVLAAMISSVVVLKRAANAAMVSPVWAVYSTNSPGLYSGRSGMGVGVGPAGVLVLGIAVGVEGAAVGS